MFSGQPVYQILGCMAVCLISCDSQRIGEKHRIEHDVGGRNLAAQRAGAEWKSKMPVVTHMVKRTTVHDGLSEVGMSEGRYVTEYTYRDPVYDGRQREFRGFREAEVKTIGDTNSPTSVSWTKFDLGEPPADLPVWKDNPNEARKGNPLVAETFNESRTVYTGTTWPTYELRQLFDGLDGRGVYVSFAKARSYVTVRRSSSCFLARMSPMCFHIQRKHQTRNRRIRTRRNKLWETITVFGRRLIITAISEPQLLATPAHPLGTDVGLGERCVRG
jgi:hypothetical protein